VGNRRKLHPKDVKALRTPGKSRIQEMPAEEELMGPGSLLIGLKTSRAHYKRRRRSSPKPRKFKISNVLTDKPGKRNRKMPGRTSSTKEEECRVQQKGTKVLTFKT